MAHLFGDWFGDAFAIVILFIIYLYLRINAKEKKNWDRLDFYFSLSIFLISSFEVIGSLVFEDYYYGPSIGFFLMILVMIITFISGIVSGIELRAKDLW